MTMPCCSEWARMAKRGRGKAKGGTVSAAALDPDMSSRAGGDEGFMIWHERLALATRRYSKVVLVGDSMVRRLPLT